MSKLLIRLITVLLVPALISAEGAADRLRPSLISSTIPISALRPLISEQAVPPRRVSFIKPLSLRTLSLILAGFSLAAGVMPRAVQAQKTAQQAGQQKTEEYNAMPNSLFRLPAEGTFILKRTWQVKKDEKDGWVLSRLEVIDLKGKTLWSLKARNMKRVEPGSLSLRHGKRAFLEDRLSSQQLVPLFNELLGMEIAGAGDARILHPVPLSPPEEKRDSSSPKGTSHNPIGVLFQFSVTGLIGLLVQKRGAALRWLRFLKDATDMQAFEKLIFANRFDEAEQLFWSRPNHYQPFQRRPRCAVYPGGLDLTIFELFPDLDTVHMINHAPFRVPYRTERLAYRRPRLFSLRLFQGEEALEQMKNDYFSEAGGPFISENLQKSILYGPMREGSLQIGLEPFILADLERRSVEILESAAVEGEDLPTYQIRFRDWRGRIRTIIYTEADAYAPQYSQILENDLRHGSIDLLFIKAFTQNSQPFVRLSGQRALPQRLLDLPPDALYVVEEYEKTSPQGRFGPENYPQLMPRLKFIGRLGGDDTPWGKLGHYFETGHNFQSPLVGSMTVYQMGTKRGSSIESSQQVIGDLSPARLAERLAVLLRNPVIERLTHEKSNKHISLEFAIQLLLDCAADHHDLQSDIRLLIWTLKLPQAEAAMIVSGIDRTLLKGLTNLQTKSWTTDIRMALFRRSLDGLPGVPRSKPQLNVAA